MAKGNSVRVRSWIREDGSDESYVLRASLMVPTNSWRFREKWQLFRK
jgi:hypothetical protein